MYVMAILYVVSGVYVCVCVCVCVHVCVSWLCAWGNGTPKKER